MTPGQVLDARNDLHDRVQFNPQFRKVMDGFQYAEFGRSGGHTSVAEGITSFNDITRDCLRVAECYRVTEDMSVLVQHAADGLDELDRFHRSLAPTPAGFVSFDRPLPVTDQRGRTMLVHFLIWCGLKVDGEPGVGCFTFNDTHRHPDEVEVINRAAMRQKQAAPDFLDRYDHVMGRWASVGFNGFANEQRLGPALLVPSDEAKANLLAEGYEPSSGSNIQRYLHALWLMMGQTIARVEVEGTDRPASRRAKKARLPGEVTVVRLRREAGERRQGESLVEWSHRFIVRGHWRWVACGPQHRSAVEVEPGVFRARTWISPYAKNAHRDDLPWIQTEKVYSLER